MNIPKSLVLGQILTIGALPFATDAQTAKIGKPLNIVIFVADDLGANDISPYGNKIIKTPNLERLASESILFSNCYAASPTCSPSRASILTGLYPFKNGAHANHSGIREGIQTLPAYLKQSGYQVALAGKLHIGPLSSYPFELIHGTNVPEPGYEGKGDLWTDLHLGPVEEWISNASKGTKPFLLVVNDHSPHVIWPEKPEYDDQEVDIPPFHIDTKSTRKSRARYYTDITKMDRNVGKLLDFLDEFNLQNNTVVIFTADQGPQWAFGKWNLYDYGIRVPLLIRYPGYQHTQWETNALVSLVDLVPTAVEIAGGIPNNDAMQLDGKSLLPIINGKATDIHPYIYASHTGDGTMNMAPMRMIRTKRYKYILNLAPEVQYNTHMNKATDHDGGREYWHEWVNKSFEEEHAASVLWRYHNRPQEELYDVQKDPDEMHNLAKLPEYMELMDEFRAHMTQWRLQQGDEETGVYKEPQVKRNEPISPYIFK